MAQLRGHLKEVGESQEWHPLAVTKQPDGTFILKVDTELVLDGANISITNLKVGSTDQTAANVTYLKTNADGTVHVTGTIEILLGVPKHYNGTANIISATVTFAGTTKSIFIDNLDLVKDIFVSFDGGVNIKTIPSGENLSLDTAIGSLDITASADGASYQILTTE